MSVAVDLRLRRGGFALEAAFEAPLAGITGLFGPSGAGKSLLLAAIAGLARLEAGRLALGSRLLEDVGRGVRLAPHRRGVGLLFQEARLFPHLSVLGNLQFAVRRAGLRPGLNLGEAAERCDIVELLGRRVRHLSGGERARVALARALLNAPELLLLDEPFAALDVRRRQALLGQLQALSARLELPMLLVSHRIEDLAASADYLLGLERGRLVACGPFAETVRSRAFHGLLERGDVGAVVQLDGEPVWASANSVLIASEAPRGLSARHVWAGRIGALRREGEASLLVEVETTVGVVLARVTYAAAAELGLAAGRPVWAIVKANAL